MSNKGYCKLDNSTINFLCYLLTSTIGMIKDENVNNPENDINPIKVETPIYRVVIHVNSSDVEKTILYVIDKYAEYNEADMGTSAQVTKDRMKEQFYAESGGPTPYKFFKETGKINQWTYGRFRIQVDDAEESGIKRVKVIDNGAGPGVDPDRVRNWVPQEWLS
jgi:hypothetical protein